MALNLESLSHSQFPSHRPERNKKHMFTHLQKSSTKLILALAACTTNCSLLIVRPSGSGRNMSFLLSSDFLSYPESESCSTKKCDTEFVCTPFSIANTESLSTTLQGASSPPSLVRGAPFEVSQYQNRANSSKWSMWGLFVQTLVNHT